ncbi:MAG: MotA/TolQ/ExbB proton channel family protein [Verrucomicrobiota bacterium]|nr:MotA/TolQ/ExbB proton channel family protein [Verrucomicrobiota bacterium]
MHLDQLPRLDLRPKILVPFILSFVGVIVVAFLAKLSGILGKHLELSTNKLLARLAETFIYFDELFLHREWVPYATNLIFFFGMFILIVKNRNATRQNKYEWKGIIPRNFHFISPPQAGEEEMTRHKQEIEKLIANIMNSVDITKMMVPNRMCRILAFWQILPHGERAIHFAEEASHHDQQMNEEGYILPKALIWAVPIMGLLGTVYGISLAITDFNKVLQAAEDMSKIKESIGGVLLGLGVAFDVTLLALSEATVITLLMAFYRRDDDSMIRETDAAMQDELLCRLPQGEAHGAGLSTPDMKEAIEGAVAKYFPKPEDYAQAFAHAFEQAGTHLNAQVDQIRVNLGHHLEVLEKQWQQQAAAYGQQTQEQTNQMMGTLNDGFSRLNENFSSESTKVVDNMAQNWARASSNLYDDMQQVVKQLVETVGKVEISAQENYSRMVKELTEDFAELQLGSSTNVAAMEKLYTEVNRILEGQKASLETITSKTDALSQHTDRFAELIGSQKVLEANLAEIQKAVSLKESLDAFRATQEELKPLIRQLAKPRKILLTEEDLQNSL